MIDCCSECTVCATLRHTDKHWLLLPSEFDSVVDRFWVSVIVWRIHFLNDFPLQSRDDVKWWKMICLEMNSNMHFGESINEILNAAKEYSYVNVDALEMGSWSIDKLLCRFKCIRRHYMYNWALSLSPGLSVLFPQTHTLSPSFATLPQSAQLAEWMNEWIEFETRSTRFIFFAFVFVVVVVDGDAFCFTVAWNFNAKWSALAGAFNRVGKYVEMSWHWLFSLTHTQHTDTHSHST